MTAYDPDVIRKHAEKLYFEAGRAHVLFTFAGAIIALVVGLGLGSWPAGVTMGVILVLVAGLIGFVAGKSMAGRMKLTAQSALCQLEIVKKLEGLEKDG